MIKRLSQTLSIAFLISISITASVNAAPVVSFGVNQVVELLPNAAGQQVPFFVTGIDQVDGLELDLQIGDGGVDLGGSSQGPTITGIDLINGTIFENSSPNQADVVGFSRARQSTVDTASKITSDGLFATVTFDTTGVLPGDYPLLLTGVAGAFDTTFFDGVSPVSATIPNGVLSVTAIPEPGSFGLLAIVGLVGVSANRQRRP